MKTLKEINIGSRVFFSKFPDFESKDKDVVLVMDHLVGGKTCLNAKIKGNDLFLYKRMPKQEWIDSTLSSGVPMKAGKFLVPEFCEYIGFTVEDLDKLEEMFYSIDDKHKYETIIYESYKENNGFFLTDEQLELAYAEYKRSRGL